jgi:hypothetical protein
MKKFAPALALAVAVIGGAATVFAIATNAVYADHGN